MLYFIRCTENDDIQNKLTNILNTKIKEYTQSFNKFIKDQQWCEAYSLYMDNIGIFSDNIIIYDSLILLIHNLNIKYVKNFNNDQVAYIIHIVNNYFRYFAYSKDTKTIIAKLMNIINGIYTNISIQNIDNLISILHSHISKKLFFYKKKYLFYDELILIQKIQQKRDILNIINNFSFQLLNSILKINQLLQKNTMINDSIYLNILLFIALRQYKMAFIFAQKLTNESYKHEIVDLINFHIKNDK